MWTGGHYSLFRVLLALGATGTLLAALGACLAAPPDGSLLAALPALDGLAARLGVGALALLAGGALALGAWHRAGATLLLLLGAAAQPWRAPAPSALILGGLLLAHLLVPPAPFGSAAARERDDPAGGWSLPRGLTRLTWPALALAHLVHALGSWSDPAWLAGPAWWDAPPQLLRALLVLQLAGVPVLLARAVRRFAWPALALLTLLLALLGADGGFVVGLLLLHAVTFEPRWVPPAPPTDETGPELLFYDGGCGLCHRAVRFVLAEDAAARFRFAPLDSDALRERTSAEQRAALPDSLVLATHRGRLLTRSAAVLAVGRRLGGVWGALARAAAPLPRGLRDALYDLVARVRFRIFPRPDDACPLCTSELAERFLR